MLNFKTFRLCLNNFRFTLFLTLIICVSVTSQCIFHFKIYIFCDISLTENLYAFPFSVHLQSGPCTVLPSFMQWESTYVQSRPLLVTVCMWSEFTCEIYSAELRVLISNTEDMKIYCYCMQDNVMVKKKKLNYFSRQCIQ